VGEDLHGCARKLKKEYGKEGKSREFLIESSGGVVETLAFHRHLERKPSGATDGLDGFRDGPRGPDVVILEHDHTRDSKTLPTKPDGLELSLEHERPLPVSASSKNMA
jgi:hypothetical protein